MMMMNEKFNEIEKKLNNYSNLEFTYWDKINNGVYRVGYGGVSLDYILKKETLIRRIFGDYEIVYFKVRDDRWDIDYVVGDIDNIQYDDGMKNIREMVQ